MFALKVSFSGHASDVQLMFESLVEANRGLEAIATGLEEDQWVIRLEDQHGQIALLSASCIANAVVVDLAKSMSVGNRVQEMHQEYQVKLQKRMQAAGDGGIVIPQRGFPGPVRAG